MLAGCLQNYPPSPSSHKQIIKQPRWLLQGRQGAANLDQYEAELIQQEVDDLQAQARLLLEAIAKMDPEAEQESAS